MNSLLLFLILIISGCSLLLHKAPPEGMIYIPAGRFIMGGFSVEEDVKKHRSELDELPHHKVYLSGFYIDKYEVTIGEYKKFLYATANRPPQLWFDTSFQKGKIEDKYPVTDVSWFEADAYCKFAGKRLPTEAEWEKAARGTEGRKYPWGDEFDSKKCITEEKLSLITFPGGTPGDKSPYGVMDMCGNVMEWTSSWYKQYPGSTLKKEAFGESHRVLKGSSRLGHSLMGFSGAAHRYPVVPSYIGTFQWFGIRCVKD